MEYIQAGLALLMVFFIVIAIVRIWMKFANHIGETLGIGNFLIKLWEKIRKISDM
ncbi:hypothetical protein SAMN05660297_02868 [Natronincola peptidivorans]|uniref:Uncharacterized protein n=1 Tax=Natronincola peptidivorans TaxID=426128 RepID=A0A1I0FMR8_9FIRM|nr:hypothetical protein [Natronincola peptidivorans]SET59426.1 hypothetical protein SAMN05660297_02868 [Natronincola peptidivorans]